jgi:hypothetical protein
MKPSLYLHGHFLSACLALWTVGVLNAASGSDLWAVLAEFESGSNDLAIGSVGEVSRYQIRPELWEKYAPLKANWRHGPDALAVAKKIMAERTARFQESFRRAPTDREFYILWNAPAQIKAPHKVVARRADRFCGLVSARSQQYIAVAR